MTSLPCRPGFFLPVRVLSRLFRGLILEGLQQAHADGRLQFFNDHRALADKAAFDAYLKPLYKTGFAVHANEPFAGPKAVLAYPSRYTHRVAIANRRLISVDDKTVTFTWKDYRAEGAERYKVSLDHKPSHPSKAACASCNNRHPGVKSAASGDAG